MAKAVIDDAYLRHFFALEDDEEGKAECEKIRAKLERLQFSHGQDICRIDDEPDGMYFLESGTCAVLDRDGEQINIMQEGQYFGEYGVLSGARRLSTVRSVGRTVVYRLNGPDMMEILSGRPNLIGEFMKRVYAQVSRKHSQLLKLSQIRRGILQSPKNQVPMSLKAMVLLYGILAVVMAAGLLLIPRGYGGPVFLLPLVVMIVHALVTKRTVESLAVGGVFAAALLLRNGLTGSYTDALIEAVTDADNAVTVLIMSLMGGLISLIEASGAVTAFQKLAERRIKTRRGALFGTLGIMAVTAIDDGLNMLCAAVSVRPSADEQRIPREHTSFLLSFLPRTLCSLMPFSLWGIFVIGSIGLGVSGEGANAFCSAIPFNFFTVLTIIAGVLFCFGRLPRTKTLRRAEQRVESGGELWPADSERFQPQDELTFWGALRNLLVPVVVLAVTSLAIRSIWVHSLVLDSACGLVATLLILFFFYCGQRIMSPEQFAEHLISGIQGMVLPNVLYLMTMCFSSLLKQEDMASFFESALLALGSAAALIPAVLFLSFTLLTVALGSSWAMFVIGFPVAIHMATLGGLHLPLCIGAICAAGLAGEMNCVFTSDAFSVGSAIGCNPRTVLSVRMPYSLFFTGASLLLYVIAGFIF